MSFHLITLQLGDEDEMLERAEIALAAVDEGETAFLPEYLAWTAGGSGRAFTRLVKLARERHINIVTSLNLAGDLIEDLPGHAPGHRYNALTIFTRFGAVHVPQAKLTPQAFEMDARLDGPGIAVSPYDRLNRVRLDVDETVIEACFLICSDLAALPRLSPAALRCDLMVVIGNFAYGAEKAASRLLGRALQAGVARTAIHVNAFHVPTRPGRQPLALEVEEVLDSTRRARPPQKWPNPPALRSAFFVYDDAAAPDFISMCNLPGRRGRIAVPRSRWPVPVELGLYPITIAL